MHQIKAWSLPEAWRRVITTILEEGQEFEVGRGSETTLTKKIAGSIEIVNPGNRPLIHEKAPADEEYLNQYVLQYLYTGQKEEGEEYTYGERMREAETRDGKVVDQVQRVIERLIDEPMDRQCTISLRYPEDIDIHEPPCLTVVDVEIMPEDQAELSEFREAAETADQDGTGILNFYTYFRSWDAFAGFPTNLGGLQLLKEWMADRVGAKDGSIYAFSKNLHLYERQFEAAEALEPETTQAFSEKIDEFY